MLNILFCGNDKVQDGLMLCLLSMTKHTAEPLHIYILTADISELNPAWKPITEETAKLLEQIVQRRNPQSMVTLIKIGQIFNDWVQQSQNQTSMYTPFCLLRLFAQKLDLPEKMLYLDTDIMLHGDIQPLYDTDITNYEIGIVKDRYGKIFINPHYFNSGMMLLNFTAIKASNLFERVKDMCCTKKMAFPDQTALNKLATKKLYLPRKFNEQGNLRKDTVVQHFTKRFTFWPYFHTVNIKPWQIDQVHRVRKNFAYDDIYAEFMQIKANGLDYFKENELNIKP